MLSAPSRSGCIYCRYQTHLLSLSSRRLRSTAAASNIKHKHIFPDANNDPRLYSFPPTTNKSEDNVIRRTSFSPRGPSLPRGTGGRSSRRDAGPGPRITFGDKVIARGEKDANFPDALQKRLEVLRKELRHAPVIEQILKEAKDSDKEGVWKKVWAKFSSNILGDDSSRPAPWSRGSNDEGGRGRVGSEGLKAVYRQRGNGGLDERVKHAFYAHVTNSRFSDTDLRNQKVLADLRYPAEWFPATRSLHRTVHLHVGPTNSGKTYHALQQLEKAKTGAYAGPLRLLAHEVYSRMNAKGRACALITGEERRNAIGGSHIGGEAGLQACTVEMMPLNKTLDVAVIDEIQMIGNAERGWAWTQALMGVKAKEVHLCGEERTVPLVRELCASVGDKLIIHKYERLSPLKVADSSLNGDLKNLRKGDCIVSFSVMGIHALRSQIEKLTNKKVATVYGSLPPETRAQQARLFNDRDNEYDYLVASDAVGMGLNLAIKRIIFEASSKFDGVSRKTLGVADIKQIGGRAGRYRTAQFNAKVGEEQQDLAALKGDSPVEVSGSEEVENVGLVTTLEAFDFPIIAAAMTAEPEPIRTAGLFPPASVLERFSSYFPPGTPFSYILMRLHELSQVHSRFHLCGLREQIWIADLIEPVQGLTISDRNVICSAPASKSEDMFRTLLPAYARCIATQTGGGILEIPELPLEVLEAEVSASREYLRSLERLHKGVVTYLWLSYRFAGIFTTRALAHHVKGLVEGRIEEVLGRFSFSEVQRRKMAEMRERAMMVQAEEAESLGEQSGGEGKVDGVVEGEVGTVEVEEVDGAGEEHVGGGDVVQDFSAEVGEGGEESALAGEHFGGEEDVVIEDPIVAELIEEEEKKPGTLSFAEWRAQQRRGEGQGSMEQRGEESDFVLEAFNEGQQAAASASESDEVEEVSEERPSIAELDPEIAAEELESGSVDQLEYAVTPETEMSEPPLETQAESPEAVAPRTESEHFDSSKKSNSTVESHPVHTQARHRALVGHLERNESHAASRP
ncbi:RNA helicase [Elasticomyces elasticus]|nr:RNA helicase [Elasticomyces elasticus]KAK3664094.1 RNA helicase [Elasticomyces elasticus]KAK4927663.1 RNA helicase [Elasticomyces elasticus]KAK5767034.1 RNA helicase [Elasticomyces elasticus]